MAKEKFWLRAASLHAIALATTRAFLLASCAPYAQPIGMTLSFQSAGRPVVVKRFDPDGLRGPTPGTLGSMGPKGGAEMAFMPGDSKAGIPQFVDIEWIVPTPEYEKWSKQSQLKSSGDQYSQFGLSEYRREWAKNPRYTQRVDITSIVTPALVDQVRSNAQNTQLKLIITFNNDNVDIQAIAYQWRR
jgi:hypothetical protein